ncbi:MAG TPA: hypothetical protein VFT43_04590, partial [Candidatus Polarisedimenticolia bacterium]|nr:hypothetical protein [Candidatus Polarisedimenticolia bacterium]
VSVEDDISSRRDILRGDARVRWGKKGRRTWIGLSLEDEKRDYTTDNVFDAFHFDRHDRRRYTSLTFHADLRKGWFLAAQAERDTNRSTFSTPTGLSSDPSDTTDYTENLVQLGLGYLFEPRQPRRN